MLQDKWKQKETKNEKLSFFFADERLRTKQQQQ